VERDSSFIPANAWTDEKGALHLRIAKGQAPGSWTCAEVRLTRSLGYGTYTFVVRDATHTELSAVLTLFAWDDLGTEQKRRELDVEISVGASRRTKTHNMWSSRITFRRMSIDLSRQRAC
jgi:hypothetical protein